MLPQAGAPTSWLLLLQFSPHEDRSKATTPDAGGKPHQDRTSATEPTNIRSSQVPGEASATVRGGEQTAREDDPTGWGFGRRVADVELGRRGGGARGVARACPLPSERGVLRTYAALGCVSFFLLSGRILWEGMRSRSPLAGLVRSLLARTALLAAWAGSIWSLLLWLV